MKIIPQSHRVIREASLVERYKANLEVEYEVDESVEELSPVVQRAIEYATGGDIDRVYFAHGGVVVKVLFYGKASGDGFSYSADFIVVDGKVSVDWVDGDGRPRMDLVRRANEVAKELVQELKRVPSRQLPPKLTVSLYYQRD